VNLFSDAVDALVETDKLIVGSRKIEVESQPG
jgi:hypothetical protein